MKHTLKSILLAAAVLCLLPCCAREPKTIVQPDEQARRRVVELESQLHQQTQVTDRWQLITVSLGIGCVVLLVVGTSLGAKTRHDATLQR